MSSQTHVRIALHLAHTMAEDALAAIQIIALRRAQEDIHKTNGEIERRGCRKFNWRRLRYEPVPLVPPSKASEMVKFYLYGTHRNLQLKATELLSLSKDESLILYLDVSTYSAMKAIAFKEGTTSH